MNNLETAKNLHQARKAAGIAAFFASVNGGPRVDYDAIDAQFSYQHGWYIVGGESFSETEITATPYDHSQGGWAFV
jgi:hypothetical protein